MLDAERSMYEALMQGVDLVRLFARPAWYSEAACAGMGVDMFFPERGEPTTAAKAVCAGCPVAVPCRDVAQQDRLHGIWGGTSARGRRTTAAWNLTPS